MPILTTIINLALVILGFGLIVAIHELGHFVAARWAGIRVLAFAVGFGPAVCSYRKGLGWRRGSTDDEYRKALAEEPRRAREISPTEYRLNAIPFGGYVRMLGQDDMAPTARSDASDSYQSCPPGKRMVVISAGVIFNVITAALLFIVVFSAGLRMEPAKVGSVAPGSPAAAAVAANAEALGVADAGLKPGDRILEIGGRKPNSFSDVMVASAMARQGKPLLVRVAREGVSAPLEFRITPEREPVTQTLQIGIMPPLSTKLFEPARASDRALIETSLQNTGLGGVPAGSAIVAAGGVEPLGSLGTIDDLARGSGGEPIRLTLRTPDGEEMERTLNPLPEMEGVSLAVGDGRVMRADHILGLMPVISVYAAEDRAAEAGLRVGDVFVRLGDVPWPSGAAGIAAIRARAGATIAAVVARRPAPDEPYEFVDLGALPVSGGGTIGFSMTPSVLAPAFVASPPASPPAEGSGPLNRTLDIPSGSRIVRVGSAEIASFADLVAALREAARGAGGAAEPGGIEITFELPTPDRSVETLTLAMTPEEAGRVLALGWESPLDNWLFEPEQFLLRASGPVAAVGMGLSETKRVMMMTYLTLVRLAQGSVKVEQLRGPVGIAHAGTIIASRGIAWLLFFMALVSVNLAVINFLPIPITDGGQFLFLVYERATGKPVSPAIQNAAFLLGLVLLAGVFLIVTFNDVMNLLGL